MGRRIGKRVWLWVWMYRLGDTLVDAGLVGSGAYILKQVQEWGIRRLLLTHHHEDHVGEVAFWQRQGVEVWASQKTWQCLASFPKLPLYRHWVWGKPDPIVGCDGAVFGEKTQMGPYTAEVIPAPGHAEDQVVFYIPARGWLFSADVFVYPRVKYFMAQEDFSKTKDTLEKLLKLDFDSLFCQHNPQVARGKEALQKKWNWLLEIEEKVLFLYHRGYPLSQILRFLFPPSTLPFWTEGEVSSKNLVLSILKAHRLGV